jgi:uncharacterized lipoprotein YmbA
MRLRTLVRERSQTPMRLRTLARERSQTPTRLRTLACAAAWLVGCGSSPEPVFYALAPSPGHAETIASRVVEVRRPALAGYLDRPDIVTRVAGYQLRLVSVERWGEPLADMIARVLAEDMADRLPASTVFSESSGFSGDPETTVELQVQRFDVGEDGTLALVVEVGVQSAHGSAATEWKSFALKGRPEGAGTPSLVAAMSLLLGRLADGIVPMLRGRPAETSRLPTTR